MRLLAAVEREREGEPDELASATTSESARPSAPLSSDVRTFAPLSLRIDTNVA